MKTTTDLRVKLFADGADAEGMMEMYKNPLVKGFTTNPTLMRKAGVIQYEMFARQMVEFIPDRPLSFEVFSDDLQGMARQARKIATWGRNVYVKIPITNTQGLSTLSLVEDLTKEGAKLNVTAILTRQQVQDTIKALRGSKAAYVSVFAGRIADTGRDPVPLMEQAVWWMRGTNLELIWASPREVLNIFQADDVGCHVITVSNDLIKKLALVGKDLDEYSLETVKMFRSDAEKAGFDL